MSETATVRTATGVVRGIAIRTGRHAPMQCLSEAIAQVDGGIEGEYRASKRRGITFLSAEQWSEVEQELGTDLPWHTRRANVLVEGLRLPELMGRDLAIGEVRIRLLAETTPCELMDELHQGLRAVLAPQCRGGIYGRVLAGGNFRLGDRILVAEPQPQPQAERTRGT